MSVLLRFSRSPGGRPDPAAIDKRPAKFCKLTAPAAFFGGKAALERRLLAADEVQLLYEIAGPHDLLALFDCASMAGFNAAADDLLASSSTVRRYETHFVKR